MKYQITISPNFDITSMCRWQIEEINSVSDSIEKVAFGEIKPGKSTNPVSFITNEIVKLCKNEVKQKRDLTSLKFNLTTEYNKIDLFKLYGLLSVKLNPLTIQMSTHTI